MDDDGAVVLVQEYYAVNRWGWHCVNGYCVDVESMKMETCQNTEHCRERERECVNIIS